MAASNILAQSLNALQMIPSALLPEGTTNSIQDTVNKVDQKTDDALNIAETYAAASLFLAAIGAFSAFGIMLINARNTSGPQIIFRRKCSVKRHLKKKRRK